MKKVFTTLGFSHGAVKNLGYSLLLMLLMGFGAGTANAQLARNSFDGTGACPTQGNSFTNIVAPNAVVTELVRVGMNCTTANGVFISNALSTSAVRDDNSYIEFSIKANSGYALNLTALYFLRQGSNTAPRSLSVSYSTDPNAANFNSTRVELGGSITSSSSTSLTLPASITTTDGGKVTFRFYPFGSVSVNGGTPGSGGTFRLDDVTLYGSVNPVGDIPPTVTSTTPANSATYVAANANIVVNFSEAVTATASSFNISGSASGSHSFALTGGPTSFTLNPDTDFADNETVTVTALASQIKDQDGTADPLAADYSFSFTTIPPLTVVKIHDIQGTGSTFNTAFGGVQAVEGIVTRKFAGSTKLNGFYVQEEDADADGNPATSEGIFVYDPSGVFTGNEGDKVRVVGSVVEYTSASGGNTSSLTEINLIGLVNLGASTLPTATAITLPVANVSDLEAYESMLVTISAATGNLAVTEYFQLGQYGQIVVSSTGSSDVSGTDARLDQYTQYFAPSVSGYASYLAELARRKIILDDGSSVAYPDPVPFGRGGQPLSASNTLRGGDQVTSLTSVLDERFEGYRLQVNTGVDFLPTNPRPVTPPAVGGTLKVASANVLNFFNGNGSGQDGSAGGFPTARGANNLNEFNRQRAKVLANLYGTGADIIGLMEVENDGYGSASAIQNLVNGLNDLAGPGSYTFVNPGTSIATDQITVAMIYKPGSVSAVGAPASLSTSAAFAVVGRQPLAQTFQQRSTGQILTVVVNHFKSKGSSSGGEGDADKLDGQGASNGTRTRQAQDLSEWLATAPTGTEDPDYLLLGDLNAYAKEDPLTTLASNGYNNLLPATSYSYVFDGQIGSLDHALGSRSLGTQVTGAQKWHINADEPSILDYNTENKSTAQQANLYSADQFRSSDHDPVLVGLNLQTPPDLTPVITARPITAVGTIDFTVVVDVFELNSVATSGPITVRVTRDSHLTLGLDTGASSVGGKPVQNSVWTVDSSNPNYYTLTTSQVIAAGSQLSFGLSGTLAANSTTGSLTVSPVILAGSGGDVDPTNNSDSDKVEYFEQ